MMNRRSGFSSSPEHDGSRQLGSSQAEAVAGVDDDTAWPPWTMGRRVAAEERRTSVDEVLLTAGAGVLLSSALACEVVAYSDWA